MLDAWELTGEPTLEAAGTDAIAGVSSNSFSAENDMKLE